MAESQEQSSDSEPSEEGMKSREEIERALTQVRGTPGVSLVKDGDLSEVLREVDSDVSARYVEATLEWILGLEGDDDE